MKFAYADPPYLGCCKLYDHYHPDDLCWDDVETHARLIARLSHEGPDGWALSLSAPSLRDILPLCPDDVRVMAWCKDWHQIRPNNPVQFAWEPVILRGGRKRVNKPMVRDWFVCNATRKTGTIGAKAPEFCRWIFNSLGAEQGDELVDLFPGSGIVGRSWDHFTSQGRLAV